MSFICFVLAAYIQYTTILYIPSWRKAVFCVQELHRRYEAAGRLRVRALQAVGKLWTAVDSQPASLTLVIISFYIITKE
jgi:hypothetical protein